MGPGFGRTLVLAGTLITSFKKIQMQAAPSLENGRSTQLINAMSFI
jgi:hypothetical protein